MPTEPLDAYVSAAPDEPTWTVQGGDPLGPPLLRVWAAFARIQAGVITGGVVDRVFEQLLKAANANGPDNERDADALLLRATATEQISWKMDEYASGSGRTNVEESLKVPGENSADEKTRIDLHDARVRAVQKLNNMIFELDEIASDLSGRGFYQPDQLQDFANCKDFLQLLSTQTEPRRLFKQEQNRG